MGPFTEFGRRKKPRREFEIPDGGQCQASRGGETRAPVGVPTPRHGLFSFPGGLGDGGLGLVPCRRGNAILDEALQGFKQGRRGGD